MTVLFEVSVVHIKYKIQLLDVNLFWNEVLRSIAYQVKFSSRVKFFVEPERFYSSCEDFHIKNT